MKAPDLNEATLQTIFDFITKELFKQNERSYDDDRHLCLYRYEKPDGGTVLKCAVGYVIPDEKYNKSMENTSLREVLRVVTDSDIINSRHDLYIMLRKLQEIHDRSPQWHVEFAKVASYYKLQFT